MHRFLLSLLVIAVLLLPFLDTRTYEAVEEHAPTIQPVNAVVGDAGFVAAFAGEEARLRQGSRAAPVIPAAK